ncbi:MerR family transcriptional regulator [Spiractinospora alimapuensis]|uniref:MerR family transcriptional regulator n=1 Tax=Spiractinospora alimapuensis TaxID=2820884 RepID=UPI001F326229|nr:MerR family transcriptional regulator [Spiractinospora alimapuensis]QVQ50288.1 MerR family transcriptional regulator [Spiractinospora alimapuensis]
MRSLNSGLRTSDVARESGYSVQQIRDLERHGVLPVASRSPSGYRSYDWNHVSAALAYRAFAAAVGPAEAKGIMRAAVRGRSVELVERLDSAHATLHRERQDLRLARHAVATITNEPIDAPRPSDLMTISELADALGVRPSTLRHWETEGLISPRRTGPRAARSYAPRDVRDARIVHQLRGAGYRVPTLRELMPRLRHTQRWEEVTRALAARETTLNARSRELVRAAAALDSLPVWK